MQLEMLLVLVCVGFSEQRNENMAGETRHFDGYYTEDAIECLQPTHIYVYDLHII